MLSIIYLSLKIFKNLINQQVGTGQHFSLSHGGFLYRKKYIKKEELLRYFLVIPLLIIS